MKLQSLGFVLLFLVSPLWAQDRSATATAVALQKKQRQTLMDEFHHQNLMDELFMVTDNSFFKPSMVPVSGRPVLLAVGLKVWMTNMPTSNIHHWVKFTIEKGKGSLVSFPNYTEGQEAGAVKSQRLETYAHDAACAYVWLVTDPAETGEVVVKAVYSSRGDWAPFADPQSAVTFMVHPALLPADKDQDIMALRQGEYDNVQKSSLQVLDDFGFDNPYGTQNVKYKRCVILRQPEKTLILNQDENQSVSESTPAEELTDYQTRNERWRYIPQGLAGLVTHWDSTRNRFGVTAEFTGKLDYSYGAPPEIQELEFSEYNPDALPAGPDSDLRLLVQKINGPSLKVTKQVSAHFNPISQDGFYAWGSSASWTTPSVSDVHPFQYHAQVLLKLVTKKLGTAAEAAGLLKLNWDKLAPALVTQPVEDFVTLLGFSFQDQTPEIIKTLPAFSRPAGPILMRVDSGTPAESMGLQTNDILILVDSQPVRSATDLAALLKARNTADPLSVIGWRDGVLVRGWVIKNNP